MDTLSKMSENEEQLCQIEKRIKNSLVCSQIFISQQCMHYAYLKITCTISRQTRSMSLHKKYAISAAVERKEGSRILENHEQATQDLILYAKAL